MLDRFDGNGRRVDDTGGPPPSAYVELRNCFPGNSEYHPLAPNPSVVTRRFHLPVRDR